MRELPRPGATIRYRVQGPPRADTLVFLHGATLDHRAWAPQVQALRHRFRVVTLDLRGHGESTLHGRFEFEDAVQDVLALLDELAAPRVVLIGLSLGGNIAQEVVYRSPELVDALVVADATCNTVPRPPLQVPMTVASLRALGMSSQESFLQRIEQTARNPDARRYVREVNKERSPGTARQILAALLIGALHADADYRIPVPTLLVHGDGDTIGDIAEGARAWAQREPNVEYAVIPHAGHVSNLDNPEAFTAALLGFLDRVLPSAPPAGRPDLVEQMRRRAARWARAVRRRRSSQG